MGIASGVIRVMIVDDHPVIRVGLSLMLNNEADIEVVTQAMCASEAVEYYRTYEPDVTLMDIRLSEGNGVDAVSRIRAEYPNARIVLFTTYDGDEDIYRGLQAGAAAYLLKDSPPEEILDAIRKVYAGQKYITQNVGEKLAERIKYQELTERELEVLREMAKGKTNAEIGDTLCVTEGTVKFHINHILTKLDVSDRTQAVLLAIRRGIVELN